MEKKIKEKIEKRQECNRRIISLIQEKVEEYPELRLGQILYILGMVDDNDDLFNLEPYDMLVGFKKKHLKVVEMKMKRKNLEINDE